MEKITNNNQNKVYNSNYKQKAKYEALFITITIITLLLSLYGKLLTFGWMTIMLIMLPIIPVHFILFTISGIQLAKVKNKTKIDYISFFILCITILLYTYTFVDAGDIGSNKAIYSINENILSYISFVCFFINIVLAIVSMVRCSKKDKN